MWRRRFQRAIRGHRRRGTTTVELALVAPIALALLFGILQVGYAYMVQHLFQDAARKGCRAAILPNSSNTAVNSTVNNVISPMGFTGVSTVIAVNGVAGDVSSANYGDQISVTVTIPLSNIVLFNVSFMNFTGTMTGADTLRYE